VLEIILEPNDDRSWGLFPATRFKVTGYFEETGRRNLDFDARVAPAIRRGRVLAIRYGEKKVFMDMSTGVRLEDDHAAFVRVIPSTLSDLLSTADLLFPEEGSQTCWACGGSSPGSSCCDQQQPEQLLKTPPLMKKCAACKGARYCSKDCQARHWKSTHKGAQCSAVRDILDLTGHGKTKFDLATFDDHHQWIKF
jgi:hypothetical protein